MWLLNSSIGRKVVMSITGIALVLFLVFHMSMNLVAIFSADAYNWICHALGANWYAIVATVVLAALTLVHFIYASMLTLQNLRARGNDRYAINKRPKGVSWASKNMYILGVVVLLGLGLHLFNFWYRMQYAELVGNHALATGLPGVESPSDGHGLIVYTFSQPIYTVLYIVWLVGLWLHLTHGFWSALHSLGLNNGKWIKRIQVISNIFSTILVAGFAAVVVYFYLQSLPCMVA